MQAPDDRYNLSPEMQAPDDDQGFRQAIPCRDPILLPSARKDFRAWRCQFEGLASWYQWTNAVTKQFAFAYMRDIDTQTVMDIPLYGSETARELLDTYQERFCLGEDLDLRLLIAQRRVAQACCRRTCCRQSQRTRSRRLLKPRRKLGICLPVHPRPVPGTSTDQAARRAPPRDSKDAEEGKLVTDERDFPLGE